MNVMLEHRKIFWLCPRTSARYTFKLLQPFGMTNSSVRSDVATHDIGMPSGCEAFEIIATVRCPYRRLLSGWKWHTQIRDLPNLSFPDFVRYHAKNWLTPMTVCMPVESVHRLIRLEHYEADVRALGILPDDYVLPLNEYQSMYKGDPMDHYDEETYALASNLYAADLKWSKTWESLMA